MLAPRMPPALHAILHERYEHCDPELPNILQWMRDQEAFTQFAHGRDPFYTHLKGTWAMLANWQQASSKCSKNVVFVSTIKIYI